MGRDKANNTKEMVDLCTIVQGQVSTPKKGYMNKRKY